MLESHVVYLKKCMVSSIALTQWDLALDYMSVYFREWNKFNSKVNSNSNFIYQEKIKKQRFLFAFILSTLLLKWNN